ncbi:hypothetical protein BB559_006579 [Furculomyces boomerangus]|uniref:Uncharacterized protein n=2 Tax=Harpellales TaxID=61421 RepID=A0A2T9Y1Q8_9FUNG|nr:hypothetical protein BB559_006579 [Furculomyces boomerangus]
MSSKDYNTPDSISKYEDHINNTLIPNLKETADLRDKAYNLISEYLKLKVYIETIEDQNLAELKLRVDLGSDFYAHAKT